MSHLRRNLNRKEIIGSIEMLPKCIASCSFSGSILVLFSNIVGDITVLASPPPVDPDDVNALTQKMFNRSLKFYMRVDTP